MANRNFDVKEEVLKGIRDFYNFSNITITKDLAIKLKQVLENMSWGGYGFKADTRWRQDLAEIAESCGATINQVRSMVSKLFWSSAFIQIWDSHFKKDLEVLWDNSQVLLPKTVDVEALLRNPTHIKIYVQRVAKDEDGYDCSEYIPGQNPAHWILVV